MSRKTDQGYEVDVDLPGFKKDEIHLELNDGYLTISTEKSLEKDEENKKGNAPSGALCGRHAAQLLCVGKNLRRRTSRPLTRAVFCT